MNGKVAYLATVRKDGSLRVHPMTPIIGQGHLFVFMEPTSPKGHDAILTHLGIEPPELSGWAYFDALPQPDGSA